MNGKVFLNGTIVPAERATVSVFDHGFLYGDGIYETIRAYDGVVFGIDEHMTRLERSASLIGLVLPYDRPRIIKAVYETLSANELRDAYIRISVSRGPGAIGLDPALCSEPSFVIMVVPHRPHPPEFYARGVGVILSSVRRNAREALNPMIKSLNFLNNIQAKREAIAAGAYEALMCNVDGFVAEGTVTNVFFVVQGELRTPALETGLLDGITRRIVIEAAGSEGVPVREELFRPEDLLGADEAFLSNSIIEVLAITEINGRSFGAGSIGPITQRLTDAYRRRVREETARARRTTDG